MAHIWMLPIGALRLGCRSCSSEGCSNGVSAGDVGSPDILARLGALAPVHVVRGNVDHGAWSANLPVTQQIEIEGFRIYMLHILAELDLQAADNVDAVIYGHSHQPKSRQRTAHSFSIRAMPGRAASAYLSRSAA
jgi:predicted phosphodiesterase